MERRATPQTPQIETTLGDKTFRRIGFGAMQLAGTQGNAHVFGPPDDPEGVKGVLRRAIELGVDHIDTAQFYGPDVVNELIHDALHPYDENLKLVTKVGARRDDSGDWLRFDEPDQLRQDVEANLRTLEIERLDLVNLRVFGEDRLALSEPTPEQLGALSDLREEGKLDLIGISNVTLEGCEIAAELIDVAEVQNEFNVMNRSDEPTLDFCREHGIAYVPYFPLGSGFAGGPARLAGDAAVSEVARKHGATPAQIALAWLLHHYDRMLLIPGTTSVRHLEQNVAAGELRFDEADMQTLENVAQTGKATPGSASSD